MAVSLKAEQEPNSCEMHLEAGRMIYGMNHDKHGEFTFCIITSLRWYKHELPTMVLVAQQCDPLFQDYSSVGSVLDTCSVTVSS